MSFRFRCPCGKVLSAPKNSVGKRARCPLCGKRIVIPVPGAEGEIPEARRAIFDPVPHRPEKPKRTKPLILIADDDDGLCKALSELLNLQGYDVITAANGLDTIDTAREQKPDLIILDVGMPKLTGFQVCEKLRSAADPKNADCSRIPILMLTIQRGGRNVRHAKSVGANDYLTKPFANDSLLRKIETLLADHPVHEP